MPILSRKDTGIKVKEIHFRYDHNSIDSCDITNRLFFNNSPKKKNFLSKAIPYLIFCGVTAVTINYRQEIKQYFSSFFNKNDLAIEETTRQSSELETLVNKNIPTNTIMMTFDNKPYNQDNIIY